MSGPDRWPGAHREHYSITTNTRTNIILYLSSVWGRTINGYSPQSDRNRHERVYKPLTSYHDEKITISLLALPPKHKISATNELSSTLFPMSEMSDLWWSPNWLPVTTTQSASHQHQRIQDWPRLSSADILNLNLTLIRTYLVAVLGTIDEQI